MDELNVKRLRKKAILPARATNGSAGYDLYTDTDIPLTIKPSEVIMIPTGIAIGIQDKNIVGLVYARSGLASKFGIAPINCVGVIDSDYRGELLVPLTNHGKKDYTIQFGDRIAQLVFTPIFTPILIETDTLDETARGKNGFGSTKR